MPFIYAARCHLFSIAQNKPRYKVWYWKIYGTKHNTEYYTARCPLFSTTPNKPRFSWRRAEYTVRNVETKPALLRAITPSKEILLIFVPESLLFIFIFIVTLILHTMQSFKHHLRSYLYFRASFLTVWKSIVSDESVNSFHASWSPSVSPSPSSTKLGDRTVIQPIPSDLREMFVIKRIPL